MPTIDTRFHGRIAIDDADILMVDYEILGFPQERRFVLLPHQANSPFLYLQSVSTPSLAFICIDPLLRFPEYQLPPNELPEPLGEASEWAVLCLCTMGNGHTPSMNLRSPLVFNRRTRRGGQFVLSLPYPVQYPLFPEGTSSEAPSHAGTHP
ncbi:flagellar assembly protein FliW [Sulfobacillus harzensis]|uniref:Flagellar assembly factor FliW n=1 Tax=Sulfobacillus harzensis TaxID=2729629 RepID=A0A7Y0L4I7_9FIRM|nr:flagellar assembly protein FliW [Sulfobacillus harzensis]NMP23080.1 flagellar assembly protein FliW [Sulfobacillus harzensis]